jgi:hypothetical protein
MPYISEEPKSVMERYILVAPIAIAITAGDWNICVVKGEGISDPTQIVTTRTYEVERI